jgi:hypothetical protein
VALGLEVEPREPDWDVLAIAQALEDLSLRTAVIVINGQPSGTGVLVAEDLVLTAAHVIDASNWPLAASKSIVTVFDLEGRLGRDQAETGSIVPVAAIVWGSPPTSAEAARTTKEYWSTTPENLDFALLRLALPVPVPATRKTAGTTASRGYYTLSPDVYGFEGVSKLLVAQDALGDFLRFSSINHPPKLNSSGTRIRYRCDTLRGSSGGPIIDTRGRLVAIHLYSMGGGVNLGIPISAIVQNLKSSRADLFGKVAYDRFERTSWPLPEGKSVFVSYSHEDERFRQGLTVALALLRRNGQISFWDDRKILPGQEWGREIDKNLETANIVLLLVSPDFIASDYAHSEMERALERHESGSAIVVPIIIRACDWLNSPIGELQALPKEGRPVKSWRDPDPAWLDVTQGLRQLISN